MHLSVIIAMLNRLETATLLAGRIRTLLPALEVEVIVVTPPTNETADLDRPGALPHRCGPRSVRGIQRRAASCRRRVHMVYGDDDYPLDAASGISGILQEGAIDLLVAPVLLSSGRIYRLLGHSLSCISSIGVSKASSTAGANS